jgi:hypothetical protein
LSKGFIGTSRLLLTFDIDAGLRRLFLDRVDVGSWSTFTFPSLVVLGLDEVEHDDDFLSPKIFPVLRHLTMDYDDGTSNPGSAEAFEVLVHQLDSVLLVSDIFNIVLHYNPSLSADKILVDFPWFWPTHVDALEVKLVHVRIRVCGILAEGETYTDSAVRMEAISKTLADPKKCRRLRSIYLPPLDSLPDEYDTESNKMVIENMARTCQKRGIEVFWEEQSNKNAAETQISEGFIWRMTKARLEREAKSAEGI